MIISSQAPIRIDFGGPWTDINIFAHSAGGIVLNATINKYVSGKLHILEASSNPFDREGLDVSYGFDLPSGSGLGTSSAMNVVWLSLIKHKILSYSDRQQIAELAYQLEEMLGIIGGKQDQYAAAFGGFNMMYFDANGGRVEPLSLPLETVKALEERSVLCYTGKQRLSGSIHENVWGAFRQGRTQTVTALYTMRDLALKMSEALYAADIDTFADLIAKNWESQKALDDSITNEQIDSLFVTAHAAGARGGKACGAGGGGCLYFVTEPGKREAVVQALSQAGARVIDFAFEFEGLTVKIER